MILPAVAELSAAVAAGVPAPAEGGIFSINPGLIIWTWVLFLLTLMILWWKVFPAISSGLEARHRKIQDSIDEARRAGDEARQLVQRQEDALAEARQQAVRLLEQSRATADSIRRQLLEEGREQQQAMLREAERQIAHDRERLKTEVRAEAVDVALAAAEKLLRERLDADQNRRVVREFLAELK
ncbi:MAG: F0F1 ATP synthase subunit B [Gemmatimonadetes bacterium]|nr:F0F1 ATP synthase subunit B [Gemmatimonadota bacterium]